MKAEPAILRELGAEARMFGSPRAAMLWYRDQLANRLSTSRDLASIGIPRSRESVEQVNATFAAVANCLKRAHPADRDPEVAAYLLSGEQQLWLVAWYETEWGDGTWLADQAGLSRWAFTRRCRRSERVLRVRLEAAGLLDA